MHINLLAAASFKMTQIFLRFSSRSLFHFLSFMCVCVCIFRGFNYLMKLLLSTTKNDELNTTTTTTKKKLKITIIIKTLFIFDWKREKSTHNRASPNRFDPTNKKNITGNECDNYADQMSHQTTDQFFFSSWSLSSFQSRNKYI